LGLAKKYKQLDERKLCSFFAKPPKQIGVDYFSSITYAFRFTKLKKHMKRFFSFLLVLGLFAPSFAQNASAQFWAQMEQFVKANYQKYEYNIPMRDGVKLFTAVYVPKDASPDRTYPIMMNRTCYSVGPYGIDQYAVNDLGPSPYLVKEKFIFVHQDVRGRYMSEGKWTNMTPHIPNKKPGEVDESTDAYDSIDWLLKNVKNHNGRVGQWGISYPGFYTSASAIDAHPALKASSPQAPIADFFFDDFHHNGAYTLGYLWNTPLFGIQKNAPTTEDWFKFFDRPTKDSYDFYRRLGPLKNASKYYGPENFFWQELTTHVNYDEFWKKRRIVDHLRNLKHAFLIVGGWFDAEDLYGALTTYKEIEKNNPGIFNSIVMGPFAHGGWSYEQGHHLHHQLYFGDSLATFYQKEIEAKFFIHFLKGSGSNDIDLPDAYMYDTGAKTWKTFAKWPTGTTEKRNLYLLDGGKLGFTAPNQPLSFSQYVSDPAKPVPYTNDVPGSFGITPRNYMSEDQRFAASRPDVLVFETDTLTEDLTLGGEITVKLWVSSTGTDADWVVKLVDVFPGHEQNTPYTPPGVSLSNYHMMVRSEVMRSRFRNSFEKPEPLKPGVLTPVTFKLQDVLHTFKKGHRVQVQVQSSWFPLIDLNPQKYVPNIFQANPSDYIKATQRVYHQAGKASLLEVEVMKK
jgi:uncharacterized protein